MGPIPARRRTSSRCPVPQWRLLRGGTSWQLCGTAGRPRQRAISACTMRCMMWQVRNVPQKGRRKRRTACTVRCTNGRNEQHSLPWCDRQAAGQPCCHEPQSNLCAPGLTPSPAILRPLPPSLPTCRAAPGARWAAAAVPRIHSVLAGLQRGRPAGSLRLGWRAAAAQRAVWRRLGDGLLCGGG